MGEISGGRGVIPGITTLPGEITGSGNANKVTKFTGAQSIGNSSITDDGSIVTLTEPLVLTEQAAPSLSAAGFAKLYADSTSHLLMISRNGGAYENLDAVGANPSASVGLTAVNGTADTFLRSDGAPALSQSIAPTWTGQHVFTSTAPQAIIRTSGGVAGTNEVQLGEASNTFTVEQKDTGGMVFIVPGTNQFFNFSRTDATKKSVILSDSGNGGYIQINNSTNLLFQALGDNGAGEMSIKGVSGMHIIWRDNASTIGAGSDDTGIKRSAAGVVKFTNGSTGFGSALAQNLTLGAVSATTGQIKLANSASANLTTFQAGNATAAVTYTLPTADGAANAHLLTNGSGTLSWDNGFLTAIITKTANYTATANDYTILCDATGGSFTITLPAAASHTGRVYNIKKIDASANTVTIDGNASETIDGSLTLVVSTQYDSFMIQSDGSNWWRL